MAIAPIRVAYSLEQCWDSIPGQAAAAAVAIAAELRDRPDDVTLLQVSGKHATMPAEAFRPVGTLAMLPLARRLLYVAWTRLNWPKVESVTGQVDVAHATGFVPCATSVPLVVTIHDLDFLDEPDRFPTDVDRLLRRSLDVIRRRADRVICPNQQAIDQCVSAGFDASMLRLVPLRADGHGTSEWRSAADMTLAVYRELVPAACGTAES